MLIHNRLVTSLPIKVSKISFDQILLGNLAIANSDLSSLIEAAEDSDSLIVHHGEVGMEVDINSLRHILILDEKLELTDLQHYNFKMTDDYKVYEQHKGYAIRWDILKDTNFGKVINWYIDHLDKSVKIITGDTTTHDVVSCILDDKPIVINEKFVDVQQFCLENSIYHYELQQ